MQSVRRAGLLSFLMLLLGGCFVWLLPQKAEAAGEDLYIAGRAYNDTNLANNFGGALQSGSVTYDADTHTLTLNGAKIVNSRPCYDASLIVWNRVWEQYYIGIFYTGDADLTINLIGENEIQAGSASNYSSCAIRAKYTGDENESISKSITFQGEGSLKAIAGDAMTDHSDPDKPLLSSMSCGIEAESVIIRGDGEHPYVEVVGGKTDDGVTYGINGGLSIDGGFLKVVADESGTKSYGINVTQDAPFEVKNSNLQVSVSSRYAIEGIHAHDRQKWNKVINSEVSISVNSVNSVAVGCYGSLQEENSNISIQATGTCKSDAYDRTAGITGGLKMNEGRVDIQVESSNTGSGEIFGIQRIYTGNGADENPAKAPVTVNKGSLSVSVDSKGRRYAVINTVMTVNDGEVTLVGNNGNNASRILGLSSTFNGGRSLLNVMSGAGVAANNGVIAIGENAVARTASPNSDGSGAVSYDPEQVNTYKYLLIKPIIAYDLWVGGVQVNEKNADDILGDGTAVSYDSERHVLTLQNVQKTFGGTHPSIDSQLDEDLRIHVLGDNTLTFDGTGPVWGLAAKNNISIMLGQDATLNLRTDDAGSLTSGGEQTSVGLNALGNVHILGDGVVRVYERDMAKGAYGSNIGARIAGDLNLEQGGKLEVYGGTCTDNAGPDGKTAETVALEMTGGTISIGDNSFLRVVGGTVRETGASLPGKSIGLRMHLPSSSMFLSGSGYATISGGTVSGPEGTASCGLDTLGANGERLSIDVDSSWTGYVKIRDNNVSAATPDGVRHYFDRDAETTGILAFTAADAVPGEAAGTDVKSSDRLADVGAANKLIYIYPNRSVTVDVTAGEGMTPAASSTSAAIYHLIPELTFTADDTHYFPEDYVDSFTPVNGIQVRRDSFTQITVFGISRRDTQITLPAATEKTKEETPAAVFSAWDASSGVLTGLETTGMSVLVDGAGKTVSRTSMMVTNLSEGSEIRVIRRTTDPVTRQDSDPQIISITRAETPALVPVQPACEGKTGIIPATDGMQYSADGYGWSECTGELTDLAQGTTYYVRMAANGTVLASDAQRIVIEKKTHVKAAEAEVSVPATCTAAGERVWKCTVCQEVVKSEPIPATGHTKDAGTVTKEPTCTEQGVKTFHCTVCHQECGTENIAPKGHTPSETGTEITEATCRSEGVVAYLCVDCGSVQSIGKIPKLDHVSDEGEITTEPTCTKGGTRTYTCTLCGLTLKKEGVAPTGHTPDEGVVTKDPTCTQPGQKTWTCTVCHAVTDTKTIPATGHTPDEGTVTRDPTCTRAGVRTFHCKVCNAVTDTENIPATGHVSDGGSITKAPTCTSKGERSYRCTVCSTVIKTETIGATGHTPDSGTVMIEPTCTQPGTQVVSCTSCHKVMEMTTIPVKAHAYVSGEVTRPATCRKTGVRTLICADCGATTTEEIPLADHTWDAGVVTKKASRSSEGVITYTCTVCGATRTEGTPILTDRSVPMYRLFHPGTHEHFYTSDVHECHVLLTQYGWVGEGIGWYAPKQGQPVYRLYNPQTTDHHYTMDAHEYQVLGTKGWVQEGIGWYSDPDKSVPLYRLYTAELIVGSHHYTSDTRERSVLLQSRMWHNEGVGWYGVLP